MIPYLSIIGFLGALRRRVPSGNMPLLPYIGIRLLPALTMNLMLEMEEHPTSFRPCT
jgi:hypothetical protein